MILVEKYWKHKKHNHSTSQKTYRWLVQLWMEKKRATLAKFVMIDFIDNFNWSIDKYQELLSTID